MAKKSSKKELRTYTKNLTTIIIGVALIDMQFPFILAMMGREQIAETLGITIATEIVAVALGYLFKSFFETYHEKKNELKLYELGNDTETTNVESEE